MSIRIDAISTLCKEHSREMTRRQYLAVSKAFNDLGLTDAERLEAEIRWSFRDENGALRTELEKQPRRIKTKQFDWSNLSYGSKK